VSQALIHLFAGKTRCTRSTASDRDREVAVTSALADRKPPESTHRTLPEAVLHNLPEAGSRANVLRSATFRGIAGAYAINELGNWIADVALAILVFDRTGNALATAALFLALRALPALLGPLLTARTETLPLARSLPLLHLGEALLFLSLAWLASHFSLAAVLVLGALDGVLATAAKALTRAGTATLLPTERLLRRGNAILNMGFSAAGAIGPALAGAIVAALGVGPALLVDAATFVLVAVILFAAWDVRLETQPHAAWRGRLRAGLAQAWSHPGLRGPLAAQALALVFFTAAVPVEVVYAKQTLHAGDTGYGALLAAWGIGMILGSVAFAAASRVRVVSLVALSTACVAAGYVGLAVAPGLALACVFSAVGGAGNGAQWIAVVTAVQHAISRQMQTTVMALLESINQFMPAIGFLLGGVVATLASPRAVYAVAGAGIVLVLLACWVSLSRVGRTAPPARGASGAGERAVQ
jgi:MFS family permease